jgi:hypothetical protein
MEVYHFQPLSASDTFPFHEIGADHCASQFRCCSVDLLRRLPKDILHKSLGSSSLELENEDEFVRVLIELGNDELTFLNYVEVNYLTKEGISVFLDQLTFDDLTPSIWMKPVDRLKHSMGDILRSDRYHRGIESMIISHYPGIVNEFEDQKCALLYRGSRNGFQSSNSQVKGDYQSTTLNLIETPTKFIFGGFTSVSWDS